MGSHILCSIRLTGNQENSTRWDKLFLSCAWLGQPLPVTLFLTGLVLKIAPELMDAVRLTKVTVTAMMTVVPAWSVIMTGASKLTCVKQVQQPKTFHGANGVTGAPAQWAVAWLVYGADLAIVSDQLMEAGSAQGKLTSSGSLVVNPAGPPTQSGPHAKAKFVARPVNRPGAGLASSHQPKELIVQKIQLKPRARIATQLVSFSKTGSLIPKMIILMKAKNNYSTTSIIYLCLHSVSNLLIGISNILWIRTFGFVSPCIGILMLGNLKGQWT